jgi:hypothetical protein
MSKIHLLSALLEQTVQLKIYTFHDDLPPHPQSMLLKCCCSFLVQSLESIEKQQVTVSKHLVKVTCLLMELNAALVADLLVAKDKGYIF